MSVSEVYIVRTASLFKNGKNQAVRLPKEFEFDGVTEVEIIRDGESLIITPKRKSWASFADVEKADEMTAHIKGLSDHWCDSKGMSDKELYER